MFGWYPLADRAKYATLTNMTPDGNELTVEQAIALYEQRFWEPLSAEERAKFQLFQERLCMPFDVFHAALEQALKRPVWTHEIAQIDLLRKEFLGERPAPTMTEIFGLIPPDKRVFVFVES